MEGEALAGAPVGIVPHEVTANGESSSERLHRLDSFSYVPRATSSSSARPPSATSVVAAETASACVVDKAETSIAGVATVAAGNVGATAGVDAADDKGAPQRRSARSAAPFIREYPVAGSPCALFEAFVVVGMGRDASTNDAPQDAEILFSFPPSYDCASNKSKLANAAKFALAEQLRVRSVARSYSNSALNKLMHGSDHAFARRHVFCFNNPDGSYEWGVCLIKDELLSMPASFLGLAAPLLSVQQAATTDAPPRAAERAYCFLSRWPLFGPLFDVLLSVLARERSHRLVLTHGQELDAAVEAATSPVAELQSVYDATAQLRWGSEVALHLFSRTVRVELPLDGADAFFCDGIVAQCFPAALQRLSMATLVRLFCAAMLCKQLVIRSRVSGVASCVVLSLSMLLRPLRWEGLMVPWLPRSMTTVLEAPVPYIIGLSTSVPFDASAVDGLVLDVDNDRCRVTSIYPLLPASVQLCNNLSPILSKHFAPSAGVARAAFDPTPEQSTAAIQVSLCFKAYAGWLCSKLMTHFEAHTECVSSKTLRESFLPTVTAANAGFVNAWLQTQHVASLMAPLFQKRTDEAKTGHAL